VLRSDAFTELSVGAPLVHPENGLVGIVARAASGSAAMLGVADIVAAATAAGFQTAEMLSPADQGPSALPPRVESETGRIYVFSDNSYIGYLGAFYGPSGGAGFDPSFVAPVSFSVWEVAADGGTTRRIAGGDKSLALNPAGMALEAPFSATPGDRLASCVVHPTQASGGRPIFVLQFWRAAPERYNDQIDDKSYDEAAAPLTGWADATDPCGAALATLDRGRFAALMGRPLPEGGVASGAASTDEAPDAAWRQVEIWSATGRAAVSRDVGDGRTVTAGCTESGETAVAVSPGSGVTRIGGVDATTHDADGGVAFALLPPVADGAVALVINGGTESVDLGAALGGCGM
jgi:hypothetical protein